MKNRSLFCSRPLRLNPAISICWKHSVTGWASTRNHPGFCLCAAIKMVLQGWRTAVYHSPQTSDSPPPRKALTGLFELVLLSPENNLYPTATPTGCSFDSLINDATTPWLLITLSTGLLITTDVYVCKRLQPFRLTGQLCIGISARQRQREVAASDTKLYEEWR